MNATITDLDLLHRSSQGDRAAFGTFMDRHASSVYRFLLSLQAASDDAEDALQECFVSAWRSAATFRGRESARGWLFAIARNALRRQYRRRVGEPVETASLEQLAPKAGWGVTADLSVRFEAKDQLEWAMNQLPEDLREAVVLRDLEGFSGDEAAESPMLGELRLDTHAPTESPEVLGPLIDPNIHSCGTVPMTLMFLRHTAQAGSDVRIAFTMGY